MGMQDRDWYREHHRQQRERERHEEQDRHWYHQRERREERRNRSLLHCTIALLLLSATLLAVPLLGNVALNSACTRTRPFVTHFYVGADCGAHDLARTLRR
jgi:hypothetical protein